MPDVPNLTPSLRRGAWLSPDGVSRYALTREWGDVPAHTSADLRHEARGVCWVMLNPSTADAEVDDPTIRRCTAFTKAWGYDRLVVVNLWALRATDPKRLVGHPAPSGPENSSAWALALDSAEVIIAAWGASFPPPLKTQVRERERALQGRGAVCLGRTAAGHPRHPLYVRGDTERCAL